MIASVRLRRVCMLRYLLESARNRCTISGSVGTVFALERYHRAVNLFPFMYQSRVFCCTKSKGRLKNPVGQHSDGEEIGTVHQSNAPDHLDLHNVDSREMSSYSDTWHMRRTPLLTSSNGPISVPSIFYCSAVSQRPVPVIVTALYEFVQAISMYW